MFNMELAIEQWLLNTGGPSAVLGYFLFQISSQLGELKGLLEGYLNGRNNTSKKNSSN